MSKLSRLTQEFPEVNELLHKYQISSTEVAVIRAVTRAAILDPTFTERVRSSLPVEHRPYFAKALQEVTRRWWHRARQITLPDSYTIISSREENNAVFPFGHPKRFKTTFRRPGRPKGAKDKNPDPTKRRGRPSKFKSKLPYVALKHAVDSKDWCAANGIPMPPSVRRALCYNYADIEIKEELYCIKNKISWFEYVIILRKDRWTPRDPKTIHNDPIIPKLEAPLAELIPKDLLDQESLRSDPRAPNPDPQAEPKKVAAVEAEPQAEPDDDDIKKRMLEGGGSCIL